MAQPATANGEPLRGPERVPYRQEIHVVLDVALVVICVLLGVAGWALHPKSHGFTAVPQGVQILAAGSGFNVTESLTQKGDDGATLVLGQRTGRGLALKNGDELYGVGGPTGGGAASVSLDPAATLNGKPLDNESWTYIVLHPGGATPCDRVNSYRAGLVTLSLQSATPTPALVVSAPKAPAPTVGDTPLPPGLCLQWDSDAPFNLSGPYLSARFPPLQGVSSSVTFTPQMVHTGDLGTGAVTRDLILDGSDTANFAIQTDPQPQFSTSSSWTWVTTDSPQLIEIAAINATDTQRENNNVFYSGVLFGIVGGALISLVTDLVTPLRDRRGRQARG